MNGYGWCHCGKCNDCLDHEKWSRKNKNLKAQAARLNESLPPADVSYIQRYDGLFYTCSGWVGKFEDAEKFEGWQAKRIVGELKKQVKELDNLQEGEVYYRIIEQILKPDHGWTY